MNKNITFPTKINNTRNKGFTLVEIIVVIVIMAILAAILIPSLTRYIDMSREKSDLGQLGLLNRVTQAYRIDASSADPFLVETNNSDDLMGILVADRFLSEPLEAKLPGAKFEWSLQDRQWGYLKADNTVISHVFGGVGKSPSEYKQGPGSNWDTSEGGEGFYSSYGLLFIPNDKEYYTITSKATLSDGTNGGYGIVFETTLNSENQDTGYILQFDRGRRTILVREKDGGVDKGVDVLKIANNPNVSGTNVRHSELIPTFASDDWWTKTHEITLKISNSTSENKKGLSIFIDGYEITNPLNPFSINQKKQTGEKFTGIRAWGKGTTFEEITIK